MFLASAELADRVQDLPVARRTRPRRQPRGTPEKRPMRDTSKPANGIRQDKVVITHDRSLRQCKTSQDSAVIGYSDNTWAEDMAPQGCDQSADPAAGNAWRRKPPPRHFWRESVKSREREGRALAVFNVLSMPQSVTAVLVRQLFGPHLSTCP